MNIHPITGLIAAVVMTAGMALTKEAAADHSTATRHMVCAKHQGAYIAEIYMLNETEHLRSTDNNLVAGDQESYRSFSQHVKVGVGEKRCWIVEDQVGRTVHIVARAVLGRWFNCPKIQIRRKENGVLEGWKAFRRRHDNVVFYPPRYFVLTGTTLHPRCWENPTGYRHQ